MTLLINAIIVLLWCFTDATFISYAMLHAISLIITIPLMLTTLVLDNVKEKIDTTLLVFISCCIVSLV